MSDFDYVGRYAYHIIVVTMQRRGVLVGELADAVSDDLIRTAELTKFELLAFSVMPNHLHVLALGSADDANLIRFMQRFKQATGFAYKRQHKRELWQWSYFDRALRRDEDMLEVARYIFGNPTLAGLTAPDETWPHQGGTFWNGAEALSVRDAASPDGAEAPSLRSAGSVSGAEAPSLRDAASPDGAEAPSLRDHILQIGGNS